MTKGALFTVVLVAVVIVLALGCEEEGAQLQVRGQVIEVVPRNFSELENFRIRDQSGKEYVFESEGFIGFTPSHVREHQLLGQTILVTYEKRGDRLVAVFLED